MSEETPPLLDDAAGRQRLNEICLDPARPAEARARLLLDVLNANDDAMQQAFLTELFRVAVRNNDEEALRLIESYEQGLNELQNGPVRPATYIGPTEATCPAQARASMS